jgi:hypothetical protein
MDWIRRLGLRCIGVAEQVQILEYRPRFGLRDDRSQAIAMWLNLNAKSEIKGWHVGLTTSTLGFADFDDEPFYKVYRFADEAKRVLNCRVAIFKTGGGYHVVALKPLSEREWRWFYKYAIKCDADHLQATLALRKHRATLRVSPKNGSQPRLVMILEPD